MELAKVPELTEQITGAEPGLHGPARSSIATTRLSTSGPALARPGLLVEDSVRDCPPRRTLPPASPPFVVGMPRTAGARDGSSFASLVRDLEDSICAGDVSKIFANFLGVFGKEDDRTEVQQLVLVCIPFHIATLAPSPFWLHRRSANFASRRKRSTASFESKKSISF